MYEVISRRARFDDHDQENAMSHEIQQQLPANPPAEPAPPLPAVELRLGIVIRFRRSPRWLLAAVAGGAGAAASWHVR